MAIERADSILDIPAITQEVNQYVALIQKSQAALVELFNITKQYKDSNIVNLTQNTEKLTVAMNGSLETTKQVAAANEKLTKTIVAHKEKTDDEIKSQIQAREALKARTDQIKVQGDAYKQLTLDYNRAAAAAKALGAQYGIQDKRSREAAEGANLLKTKIDAINGSVGQSQGKVGSYSNTLKEFAGNIIAVGAAYFGAQGIFQFIKSSIQEFGAAQLATTRLDGILSNLGRNSSIAYVNAQVKELTDKFKTLKEADITDVFQRLYTYGKLSENQMHDLIPVIIDFASKQGIDLAEATGVFTKALEGNNRGLKDYGINIKEGHDTTERFGIVMAELKNRVDGAALAFGETLPGAIKKSEVEIDELKKGIGEQLQPVIKDLLKTFHDILGGGKIWIDAISNVFSNIKRFTLNPTKGAQDTLDQADRLKEQTARMEKTNNALADFYLRGYEFEKQDSAGQEKLIRLFEKSVNSKNKNLQYALKHGASTEVVSNIQNQLDIARRLFSQAYQMSGRNQAVNPDNPKTDDIAAGGSEDKLKELEDFAKGFISILDKIGEYDEKTGENALTGFQKEIKQAIDENKNFNREIEELRTADQEKLKKHFADGEIELKQYTDVSRGINEHAHADQVAAELALQNRIKEIKDKFEKERDAKAFADAQKQHDKMAKEMADKSKQDVEDELAAAQLAFQKSGKLKDQLKEIQKQKDVSDHSAYAQFGEFGTTPDSGRLTTELGKNAETATSDASKAKEDAAVKVIDKIKNYSVDAEHIIGGIIDDETTKKLNALNKIEVAQQKAYEKEIAGVNLSSLSQQDKAAKLKILESDRQVQVEQNARAQKKIDEDKAKFDKAKSIVSIIESTAEGVIKALVSTPPDIPLALIVGALGASELAIAIAQPIPHYKEGTMKGHTGGIAVVGDGGVRELILEPGKDPYYSPAVPTVMSLAKHTQVIPIDQVEEMRRGSMQVNPFGYLVGEGNTPREIVNQLKIQNSIQQKQLEALARIANKRDRPIIIKNDVSNYEKRVRI